MFETFVRRLATASAPSRKRAHGPQLLRPASLLPPIDDLAPFWLCRKVNASCLVPYRSACRGKLGGCFFRNTLSRRRSPPATRSTVVKRNEQ